MKDFIYCTDLHLSDKKPRFRTDENYGETCINKFIQIVKIAYNYKCNIIICGGDLFDKPNPNDELVNRITEILLKYNINFITLVGNHSCIGDNPRTFAQCRLGLLNRIPKFNVITGKCISYVSDIKIGFVDYKKEILKRDFYFPQNPEIIISHNYWVPKHVDDRSNSSREIENIPVLKNTQIILLGHYHNFFEFYHNGILYLNPGSIMRKACTEENINRMPKIVYVNAMHKKIKYEIKELDVKKCPFMIKEKKVVSDWEDKIQIFVKALKSSKVEIGLSLKERFRLLLNRKGLNDLIQGDIRYMINSEIVGEILRRLE